MHGDCRRTRQQLTLLAGQDLLALLSRKAFLAVGAASGSWLVRGGDLGLGSGESVSARARFLERRGRSVGLADSESLEYACSCVEVASWSVSWGGSRTYLMG